MIGIAPLPRAEVAPAARILAAAFADDAVVAEFVPHVANRQKKLEQLFTATIHAVGLHRNSIDAARDDDGQLLGVAIWEASPSTGESWRMLTQAPRYLAALRLTGMIRWLRTRHAFTGYRPTEPHWYLSNIGAAPAARGKGIGSALLRHRLDLVDGQHQPACLEATTPDSQRLYQRFGFQTHSTITVLRATEPTAMIRPARA
ncbi:GNAT family N-acetyltransferase [Micromonospora sp. NBC_01412]|uniref:GNAT family N-acetyltransferase n=1 Tax=Micromonospora sp. NBC_01412 TaxID=2903590 RepID=UPI003245BB56